MGVAALQPTSSVPRPVSSVAEPSQLLARHPDLHGLADVRGSARFHELVGLLESAEGRGECRYHHVHWSNDDRSCCDRTPLNKSNKSARRSNTSYDCNPLSSERVHGTLDNASHQYSKPIVRCDVPVLRDYQGLLTLRMTCLHGPLYCMPYKCSQSMRGTYAHPFLDGIPACNLP